MQEIEPLGALREIFCPRLLYQFFQVRAIVRENRERKPQQYEQYNPAPWHGMPVMTGDKKTAPSLKLLGAVVKRQLKSS